MYRAFSFLLVLGIVAMVQAQLTFSTGWGQGKRSVPSEGCATEDSIYAIYKLIQREAEKFLACQTDGRN